MDESIRKRLIDLEASVYHIGNYSYGPCDEEYFALKREIGSNLSEALDVDGMRRISYDGPINIDKLLLSEKKVMMVLTELQEDPVYQEFLKGYKENDQEVIGRLAKQVFYLNDSTYDGKFYHGVAPNKGENLDNIGPFMSVDDYIGRVLKIHDEGLFPSKGLHPVIDNNIKGVFMVPEPENAFGLLFFELDPHNSGYLTFLVNVENRDEITYTPKLKIPMKLFLRSRNGMEHASVEDALGGGKYLDNPEVRIYRDELENRLMEQKVDFTIFDPQTMVDHRGYMK